MKKFLVCLVRMWIVDFLKHAVQCTNQTGYEMMCSFGILTSTECLCSLILLLTESLKSLDENGAQMPGFMSGVT